MKHLGEWLAAAGVVWFFFWFLATDQSDYARLGIGYLVILLLMRLGYQMGLEIHKEDHKNDPEEEEFINPFKDYLR